MLCHAERASRRTNAERSAAVCAWGSAPGKRDWHLFQILRAKSGSRLRSVLESSCARTTAATATTRGASSTRHPRVALAVQRDAGPAFVRRARVAATACSLRRNAR